MISLIVPVYNSAGFLDKCINSIVSQSYRNIEIILVNDGSVDNSGEICNKWSLCDARIKVIHQSNSGVAAARNRGISVLGKSYVAPNNVYTYSSYRNVQFLNNANHQQCQ